MQQAIEIEVVDSDEELHRGVLTIESDPAAVNAIWVLCTFGVPVAMFRLQGQSFWDYLSRPRYVRALEYIAGSRSHRVAVLADDARQLLHYFQNPIPGNVWAVKSNPDEYLVISFDRLRVVLKKWGILSAISDIQARQAKLDARGERVWKSLKNGDVAQIFRSGASLAYRPEAKDLPRVVVDAHPQVFVRLEDRRIPMRLVGCHDKEVTAVTQNDYRHLCSRCPATGFAKYAIAPESISLAAPLTFPELGGGTPEEVSALERFHVGTIERCDLCAMVRGEVFQMLVQ